MTEDTVYTEQDLKELFKVFDQNGDGRISRSEFALLLSRIDADADDLETDLAFSIIDSDGSGTASFEEFAEWWQAR